MERDRYQLMKYLKELRKAKGITQKELAQKMEYSQQGISKLEHYNSNTTLDTFLSYCHYLGINVFQIIQEKVRYIIMAKTAQVNGQMELNFTEQKFPKKRSIAKKSVSKPKKEIKKQIAFSSEHYEKAIEIVKEREIKEREE